MPGVARLAADHRVLQVDEAEKLDRLAQSRARRLVLGKAEEQPVSALRIAGHRRDHVGVQPLVERALLADRSAVLQPDDRAVIGRRHLDALHRRVAAGIFGKQLVPDIEPGADVPDALQQRQQPVFLGQVRHQIGRRPQAQQRVVVVGQDDVAVLEIDMARHVDERRFRRRDDAQRLADRAAIAHDHLVKQIRRARLIALQDRFGQLIESLVLANVVQGCVASAIFPQRAAGPLCGQPNPSIRFW